MVAIAFLVFYGNSMIAPLVPALARGFGVHPCDLKWLIPGFSLLYGAATLIHGLLSDRFGRYPVLRILLICTSVTTLSLSFAISAHQLLLLPLLSGAGTGGIATIALTIIGDHYPYAVQGRPMGRMFGAIAAGMGLGSSLGPLLNPLLGWRNELRFIAFGFGAAAFWVSYQYKADAHPQSSHGSLWDYAREYRCILHAPRGGRALALSLSIARFMAGFLRGLVSSWPVATTGEKSESGLSSWDTGCRICSSARLLDPGATGTVGVMLFQSALFGAHRAKIRSGAKMRLIHRIDGGFGGSIRLGLAVRWLPTRME